MGTVDITSDKYVYIPMPELSYLLPHVQEQQRLILCDKPPNGLIGNNLIGKHSYGGVLKVCISFIVVINISSLLYLYIMNAFISYIHKLISWTLLLVIGNYYKRRVCIHKRENDWTGIFLQFIAEGMK